MSPAMIKDPKAILSELESAFFDIPFGNSDFQNQAFIIAAEYTPARAYRAIGLKMMDRLQAINELKADRKRKDIDIEEKQAQIDEKFISEFQRRRLQIDIDQILEGRRWEDKLLNDAIHELNYLYNELQKYPQYTRDQFEAEEQLHYQTSLQLQASQPNSAVLSLTAMQLTNDMDQLIEEAKNGLTLTHSSE